MLENTPPIQRERSAGAHTPAKANMMHAEGAEGEHANLVPVSPRLPPILLGSPTLALVRVRALTFSFGVTLAYTPRKKNRMHRHRHCAQAQTFLRKLAPSLTRMPAAMCILALAIGGAYLFVAFACGNM